MNLRIVWQKGVIGCGILVISGLMGCALAGSELPPQETPATDVPDLTENPLLTQIQGQVLPITAEVELGGQTIGLEVAETSQQQAIGLMYRDLVADDRGMLFPFDPPRPANFWMKNVRIPLDMVFVFEGEIVAIASNVPPCEMDPCPTYGPGRQPIEYVIELRGGRAEELGLQAGDPVEIQWLDAASDTAK